MWLAYTLAATMVFSLTNVLDSLFVHYFERNPVRNQWSHAATSVVVLSLVLMIMPVSTEFFVPFLIAGVVATLSDLLFIYLLAYVDVSLLNLAWSLQSVFIAATGLLVFHERWTWLQAAGAFLIVATVIYLSIRHVQLRLRIVLLLCLVAVLNGQYFLVQKYVLLRGGDEVSIFLLPLFIRESSAFLLPWAIPSLRAMLRQAEGRGLSYFAFACVNCLLFLVAMAVITLAYASGPASYVSITGNVQPFLTLFFAWARAWLLPRYAVKEELTRGSVLLKIFGFISVFLGLALLVGNQ